jgi:enediyne biosynthesis protein E7
MASADTTASTPGVRHWLLGSARAFGAAPHLFVAELARAKGGLARFRLAHKRFLATASPEIAHHVLVSRRDRWRRGIYNRKLGTILGESLLVTEGAPWKRHHDMIQPLLRRGAMRELVPVAQCATRRMLALWESRCAAGEPISLVDEAQSLALSVMAEKLLSSVIDPETARRFGTLMRDGALLLRQRNTSMLAAPMWFPTPRNRRLAAHRRELDAFFAAHVDAHAQGRPGGGDDLLARLMAARDVQSGASLSRAALIDEVKTLFIAGFETTATALTWTLYLLARNPEVAARWHAELDRELGGRAPEWDDLPRLSYTGQVLNEAMRLYPPVYNVARECCATDEIAGERIAPGATMLISIYGVHRSASWGGDVDSFRPERFAPGTGWPRRSFLPFASGEHICVGNHFALTEMMVALAMIGQRFHLERTDRAPVTAIARITLAPPAGSRWITRLSGRAP